MYFSFLFGRIKFIIPFFLVVLFYSHIYAQDSTFSTCTHYNCIIFIDGKLDYNLQSVFLSYEGNNGVFQEIELEYRIGELRPPENQLPLDLRGVAKVSLSFTHFISDRRETKKIEYTCSFVSSWLTNDYLIVNVVNRNKRKGTYDVFLYTSTFFPLGHRRGDYIPIQY